MHLRGALQMYSLMSKRGKVVMLGSSSLKIGFGRFLLPVPRILWWPFLNRMAQNSFDHAASLSDKHHLVRNLVVTKLPRYGNPLEPATIANQLDLSISEVNQILEELESGKTFLYRDTTGSVEWAYPVTAANTPHHLTFSTGENIYGA